MKIIDNGTEIAIKSAYEDHQYSEGYVRPALHIIIEQVLTSEQVSTLVNGSIVIADDEGTEITKYEGYTKLSEIAISLTRESEAEKEISSLRAELAIKTQQLAARDLEIITLKNSKLVTTK
jgi:hypothetical protein